MSRLRSVFISCSLARVSLLAIWLCGMLGGAPIEAVRVRVPAERVTDWFPRGTEIRSLTLEEFDKLFKEASQSLIDIGAPAQFAVSRADHFIRWDQGELLGRTELKWTRSAKSAGWLPLGVWSPSIVSSPASAPSALRADGQGRVGLWIDASTPETVVVEWRLRARPNSRGRAFALDLPSVAVTRLQIDLPEQLAPDLKGVVMSATADGPATGRKTWTFVGPGGAHDLRLREPSSTAVRAELRPWVSGTTRVDVGLSGANWLGQWTVDFLDGGSRSLEIELDEGLELIEIKGSKVTSFRGRRVGKLIRATVAFDPSVAERTEITIRAAAQPPPAGLWTVPAARALDAVWLGGRTTIQVDRNRTVTDCKIRSGSRVASETTNLSAWPTVITIEPTDPVAVADLTLQPTRQDTTATVTGLIQFDGETPRMQAQVRWGIKSGILQVYVLELTPGWSVARVESESDQEAIPWRSEPLPGGRSRLTLLPPPLDDQSDSIGFVIQAAAPPTDLSIPFDFPRLVPVGVAVVDDRWVALTRRSEVLRPTFAKSLAWLNPEPLLRSNPRLEALRNQQQRATAWRWLGDDAEGRARVVTLPSTEIAQIRQRVVVDSERITIDTSVDASPVSVGEELFVHLSAATRDEPVWVLETTPPTRLPSQPIPPTERAALGLPAEGSAWRIRVPRGLERVNVSSRTVLSWSGEGAIPLVHLSSRTRSTGIIEVRVAPELLAEIDAREMRVLPLEAFLDTVAETKTAGESRLIRVLSYEELSARLSMRTRRGASANGAGMIREAVLTSIIEPQGDRRHRLLLQVASLSEGSLDLTFPKPVKFERIARDGQPVDAVVNGGRVSLPLGPMGGSRSFTLDYTSESETVSSPLLRPDLPVCPLPFASFCWEISTPPGWDATQPEGGLRPADPRVTSHSTLLRQAGRTGDALGRGSPSLVQARPAEDPNLARAEVTLGDWLLSLEGDTRPLIVDRLALLEAGWGPRSRIRTGSVGETLDGLGLLLQTYPDALLLTTVRSIPPDQGQGAGSTGERLLLAGTRGGDRDDRFLSVERWRGEPTPRGYRSAAIETWPWPDRDISGWNTHRFVSGSAPRPDASVRLERRRSWQGWTWSIGCGAFALGIALLCWSGRARLPLFAVVLAVALVAANQADVRWAGLGGASALGLLFALAFRLHRLGRRRSPRRPRESQNSGSRTGQPLARTAGAGVGVLLLAMIAGSTLAQVPGVTKQRILALLPYEGAPTPNQKSDRVLIRLSDDQTLRFLAGQTRTRPNAGVSDAFATIVSTFHRIERLSADLVKVESVYDLIIEGKGRASWRFPIGSSIDITASLDNVDIPIALAIDQPEASLDMIAPGKHRVRLERKVPLTRPNSGAALSLPVVPAPNATLEIAADPEQDKLAPLPELANGGVGRPMLLGPTDRLVLNSDRNPKGALGAPGRCEALVLWDAVTAGDLARARLTWNAPEGIREIRLAIDAGTSVRPEGLPGLVDLSLEGTADRPVWVARVDPPLASGTPISVWLWRPLTPTKGLTGSGDSLRVLPRFTPAGVENFAGIVALRHPAEWVGRLGTRDEREAVGEEAFSNQWGPFPSDDLTLSGAVRFGVNSLVAVRTGPPAARLQARPKLDLKLEEGRVEVQFTTQLRSTLQPVHEAELVLPPGFVLVRAEADGMTALERSATDPTKLRFRFDGARSRDREVRVIGRFDLAGTVPLTEVRRYELEIAPFGWTGAISDGLMLKVESAVRAEVLATGLQPGKPDNDGPLPGVIRSNHVLPVSTEPVRVRWASAPPQVRASVDSRLRLLREGVEWQAFVRYDIEGAPLDGFFIRVPAEWAEALEVESPGVALQVRKEPRARDTVILALKPESSVWGSATIELRAKRTVGAATTLDFPDAAPLGEGAVEKRLSILRTKTKRLPLEASDSLTVEEPTPVSKPDRAQAGGSQVTYRVKSEPWSLRVKIEPDEEVSDSRSLARVVQTSLSVTRLEDGATWGQGRFDVEPVPGRCLGLDFADAAEVTWAVVDGQPVQALRHETGSWLIPIERPILGRVVVAWRTNPQVVAEGGLRRVPLPRVLKGMGTALVSIIAPETGRPRPTQATLPAISEAAWWVEAVERRARRLGSLASEQAFSDPSSYEALVDGITEWVLIQRMAERAVANDNTPRGKEFASRIDEAGVTLLDTLELLGLEDLGERGFNPLRPADERAANPARPGSLDPYEPIRLRQLGNTWRFLSNETTETGFPVVLWEDLPQPGWWQESSTWWSLALWIGVITLAVGATQRWRMLSNPRLNWLVAVLVFGIGVLIQPVVAVAAGGFALLGRLSQ